jgi:hypothetical protein
MRDICRSKGLSRGRELFGGVQRGKRARGAQGPRLRHSEARRQRHTVDNPRRSQRHAPAHRRQKVVPDSIVYIDSTIRVADGRPLELSRIVVRRLAINRDIR